MATVGLSREALCVPARDAGSDPTSMKFALLGDDPQAVALVRAAVAGGHELVWIGEVRTSADVLQTIAPHAERSDLWESLLDHRTADVVIVGQSDDEDRLADQLRKLVQAGVPLLVSHPVCASMLVYYELDMIRRETSCIMRYYWPGITHPAIDDLAQRVSDASSEIGAVEQIVFERSLPVRNKQTVLEQFARDVDLLVRLSGDVGRVGALGASDQETAYATLSVQMSGTSGTSLRWSVKPADDGAGGTLSLLGTSGRAVLHMPTTAEPWTLEQTVAGQTQQTVYADRDEPAAAIEAMVEAAAERNEVSTWSEAARAVELAEAVERSLQKGRTIELHSQEFTEESTFKGTMTSLGCGLLIAALLVIPLVGILGDSILPGLAPVLEKLHVPTSAIDMIRSWPLLLLVVFVLFLLLQLLPKLVLPERRDEEKKR